MAIYTGTNSVANPQSNYPENAVDGTEWGRTEPLMNAELLVQRFLFGIPLVSQVINPITKKYDVKTPAVLTDHIVRAVAQVEDAVGINILPVQREEQHAFDRVFLEQYSYFRTRCKPILSVEGLVIRPANNPDGTDIYTVPKEWLSFTQAAKGQINIVPVIAADALVIPQVVTSNGAAFLLAYLSQLPFAPSYWNIKYTAGFPEGKIPVTVNEMVGCRAAIDILSDLAATYRVQSYSLSLDAMSQSQSGPGPRIYQERMQLLQDKYDKLVQKFKAKFGVKIAASQI